MESLPFSLTLRLAQAVQALCEVQEASKGKFSECIAANALQPRADNQPAAASRSLQELLRSADSLV